MITLALLPLWLASAEAADGDVLLDALDTELQRTMTAWEGKPDAPYFLGYRVLDSHQITLGARYGQPESRREEHSRTLDVTARVGSYEQDSSQPLRTREFFGTDIHMGDSLPVSDHPDAIRTIVWAATNKEIRDAQEKWTRVKTDLQVRVDEEDQSDNFSREAPVTDHQPLAALELDEKAWQTLLIDASERLDAEPEILWSSATLDAVHENHYVVTSEGTSVRHPRVWNRIALQTWARSDDGTVIRLYRWKDVADPSRLPAPDEVQSWADELAQFTVDVLEAPEGEPYNGPLLLRGRAAGVFVHEVIGHRVEGHRQKDTDEGQTFKDKVGEQLLPKSLSIFDDPTLPQWAGFDLNGHYAYDQEGVPAQRADLVKDGVFTGFLMSRTPIEGFSNSNGHGRAQAYRNPTARMANTIVQTTDPQSFDALKKQLIAEAKEQGREYGLIIDEIAGGFTLTGRTMPNAFNVRATYAWKVFVDGRPDELVRGVDLVGTPLVALTQVVAAGDDPGVFNGFCGAESGSVPNSAVSPSLLIRQLEIQKKEKGTSRPPILPKPTPGGTI